MDDIRVIKGKGRSRLEVNDTEVLLLCYLEQQHVLTTEQLYRFITKILGEDIHPYSFKNRLRRMEKYKLVRSSNFAEKFDGERFKYFTIGTNGIDLLIKEHILLEDYNKNQIYQRLEKKNLLHFLYTQESVLNILCSIKERSLLRENSSYCLLEGIDYVSLSPAKVPYETWIPKKSNRMTLFNKGVKHARTAQFLDNTKNYERKSGDWAAIIRPDWIIKRKFEHELQKIRYLNIELDTGTESLEEIED